METQPPPEPRPHVSERRPEKDAPAKSTAAASVWTTRVSLFLLVASVLGPLAFAGLWDPPELSGAEFGRRIAVNLLDAEHLQIAGANNDLPSVEEVGRGELPFFLSAFGFRVFGLHDWAGRLPLALAALLGAFAIYLACRRLAGSRHAALTVLVLASTPLFFAQARTLLGDSVTTACSAVAFALLLLASADARLSLRLRLVSFAVGVGAVVAGVGTRGVLVAALPALAVGLSWLLTGARPFGEKKEARGWFGLGSLVLGLAGAVLGLWALKAAQGPDFVRLLGTKLAVGDTAVTHDFVIHQLGHALFPWSAFLPVALGLAVARPSRLLPARAELQVGLLAAAGLGVLVHTALPNRVGPIPFSAVYALSGIAALGVLELDRARRGVPAVAMCTAAFAVVLFSDFRHFPEKSLSVFAMAKAAVPENFENATKLAFAIATLPVLLVCVVLVVEPWPLLQRARDFVRARVRRFRSILVQGGLTLSGLILGLGYYPALLAHLSPVGVFETYADKAQSGEPLATTGKGGNASAYYGSGEQRHFERERDALAWLLESPEQRRWLIVKKTDLAQLTSSYRQQVPAKTLPVLDARSGDVLLASNLLRPGEANENPLARFLPETLPAPAHPVKAAFGDKLRVIGWEVRDPKTNAVVNELTRGRAYRLQLYYEVLGRITQNWKTFVHLDASANRINADHDTLGDEYAFRHWNKGDFITDEHVFELEPDAVAGRYTLYFGLYSGKSRMDVTMGGDKDDRVIGGTIRVL
jgi:4-amino-4-deoxy-L-arabinose transferase-like glycosyltransferase